MTKFVRPLMFVIVAMSFLLAACGGAATPQTVTQIQTQIVNQVITATPDTSQPTPLPAGSVQINGAGATFPLPIYTEWTYAYSYVDPSVVINYQGIGSGGGKKAIVDGTVDFAGSDSLLKPEEYDAGKDLQMYPMVASAVVPIYNIAWAKEVPAGTTLPALVLDRQTLVDIYNAKVTKWNDPAIVKLNADLTDYLPNASITAVHRSDGSGTTEQFTLYLASAAKDVWKLKSGSTVEWPADTQAGNGNPGVAQIVKSTKGAVGYVDLSDAKASGLHYATVKNQAGKFIEPTSDTASAAGDGIEVKDNLLFSALDSKADGAYPITYQSWVIVYAKQTDKNKGAALKSYIKYLVTEGQPQLKTLDFAPLPKSLADKAIAQIDKIQVP